jgi:hypothetical protein
MSADHASHLAPIQAEFEGADTVDLFEYQAIAQGGWIMPDVAGCVIELALCGLVRLGVAG